LRRRYLLSYDIAEAKRLKAVFRLMRGYGNAVHYSVFLCDLSVGEKALMMFDLRRVLNMAEDRVFIVDLGPAKRKRPCRFETLGREPDTLFEIPITIVV
jgi:CRISPR-associated protein Cas2